MKKILAITILSAMLLLPSCKKSPEKHCSEAIEHIFELTLEKTLYKKIPKDIFDKMKEKMKEGWDKQKEKIIKECVKDYKKESVDCVINAKNFLDFEKCNFKK